MVLEPYARQEAGQRLVAVPQEELWRIVRLPGLRPKFRAELFDADKWADIFARSGARYIVPTSKHHEGFCLWPSAEASRDWGRPWNAVETGPHRDLMAELAAATRKRGLKFGFYYSLYEWYNPLWLSDRKRFVDEHLFPQFKDVVTRYQPAIIFSDGEWDMHSKDWKSEELLAWLFNESGCKDEVVVNDRWGKECRHKHGGYWTTEYAAGLKDGSHPWEESRGMGYSYGYNRAERIDDYKSAREFILVLCDLVSRGGNLLLDIGPNADGTIPGHHGAAAAGDRRLAARQRRSDLRHAIRRPQLPVERGQASRPAVRRIHGEVRPHEAGGPEASWRHGGEAGLLHEEARRAVCDYARLAR